MMCLFKCHRVHLLSLSQNTVWQLVNDIWSSPHTVSLPIKAPLSHDLRSSMNIIDLYFPFIIYFDWTILFSCLITHWSIVVQLIFHFFLSDKRVHWIRKKNSERQKREREDWLSLAFKWLVLNRKQRDKSNWKSATRTWIRVKPGATKTPHTNTGHQA